MKLHFNARGSILILALWSVAILTVFVVSLGSGALQKSSLLARLVALDTLYSVAYSGVEKARGLLKNPDETKNLETRFDDWFNRPSLFRHVTTGTGYFSVSYPAVDPKSNETEEVYGLIDEERKINLNKADAPTLGRLFEITANLSKDTAEDLGYCIVDWRDSDATFQHPSYGAESGDYKDLPDPYEAKDAPFEVIDELLLVKGLNREIFDKVRPFVTVYGQGAVNINTASKEALEALASGVGAKIFDYCLGPDRSPGTLDDRYFKDTAHIVSDLKEAVGLNPAEQATLESLVSTEKFGTSSSFFMVKSKAAFENQAGSVEGEAVMDRLGKVYYSRFSKVLWTSKK